MDYGSVCTKFQVSIVIVRLWGETPANIEKTLMPASHGFDKYNSNIKVYIM